MIRMLMQIATKRREQSYERMRRMEADGCELTLTYLSGLIDGLEFVLESGIASYWGEDWNGN